MPTRCRLDPVGAGVVGRDQQHLVGAFERVEQRRRVVVGAAPHADAAVGEVLRLGDVAHADADLVGGDALEQVLDGGAVEGAGGAGDDDHVLPPFVLSVIRHRRYQGKYSVSKFCYHR